MVVWLVLKGMFWLRFQPIFSQNFSTSQMRTAKNSEIYLYTINNQDNANPTSTHTHAPSFSIYSNGAAQLVWWGDCDFPVIGKMPSTDHYLNPPPCVCVWVCVNQCGIGFALSFSKPPVSVFVCVKLTMMMSVAGPMKLQIK